MDDLTGPVEVLAGVDAALTELERVPPTSAVRGTATQWAEVTSRLQVLVNRAGALQDVAITRLAAIEVRYAEDGTLVETHRAPGHVALDAPAIVSGLLATTAVHAERRVQQAVRRVADGPEQSGTGTGLGGLHAAMVDGRLDAYRAGVVAEELELAPPEVARAVVAAVEPHVEVEDGPRLRRRCRRMLARISPDLLRQRAVAARSESRLERWASEPGVDTWHGTFPSEEAARAWAAVDGLAQRYVADGVCPTVDRARAKALTDLVTGNATVQVQVSLTVPAEALPTPLPSGAGSADDLVEAAGLRPGEPALVARGWLAQAIVETRVAGRDRIGRVRLTGADDGRVCDPTTGALLDPGDSSATEAYRPGARLSTLVRSRDGRCRFPGCHVAARFCDVDHVRAWPVGPTSASNLICLCRRHHRVKQRAGWWVRLDPDGTVTWTDPTGRVRTTLPVDALDAAVLVARGDGTGRPSSIGDASTPDVGRPVLVVPDGPHSHLEFTHEHRLASHPGPPRRRVEHHRQPAIRWSPVVAASRGRHGRRAHRRRPPPGESPPF